MKGINTLHNHGMKKVGIGVATIGLAAMLFEKFTDIVFFKDMDATQHYGIFQFIALFGLFLIGFSKERVEDERVEMIRARSLRIAFMLMQAVMLGNALGDILEGSSIKGPGLLTFSAIGIIFYVTVFHIGLYFDNVWEYKEKGIKDSWTNYGKNSAGIFAYFIAAVILILSLFLFK